MRCSACGKLFISKSIFCRQCGNQLQNSSFLVTRFKRLSFFLTFMFMTTILTTALVNTSPVTSTARAADDCQLFPETGFQVCGKFLAYWKNNGGLTQQGYPISNVVEELNAPPPVGDGKLYKVQYFQRARFEDHPENQPPFDVLLGLLGSEQYQAKYANPAPATTPPVTIAPTTIAPTTAAPTTPAPTAAPKVQFLTVRSTRYATIISSITPVSGSRYFIADILITNTTDKKLSSSPIWLSMKTDKAYSYDVAFEGYLLPKNMKSVDLAPGEAAAGEVAFEIPATGETPISITYDNWDFDFTVRL